MEAIRKFLRLGLQAFMKREDGLVAVEWVAMAAAVVVGGIALVWMVMNALGSTAGAIGTNIASTNTGSCGLATSLTTASC